MISRAEASINMNLLSNLVKKVEMSCNHGSGRFSRASVTQTVEMVFGAEAFLLKYIIFKFLPISSRK